MPSALRSPNLLLVALLLARAPVAFADTIIDSAFVNETLAQMAKLANQSRGTGDHPAQHDALYRLGMMANNAAIQLSKEMASHGKLERNQINRLITEATEYNVIIHWSESRRRFYYDGAAFRQYVELQPRGEFAAECRYRIIEHEFYFSPDLDYEEMVRAADKKLAFVHEYPAHQFADKVSLYLSIDYRDLWRQCKDNGDKECASQHLELAQKTLNTLIDSPRSSSKTAQMAARMLQRIEGESAHAATFP